ncbi:MAG: hypothetical protein IJL08_05780, partial [Oscillospiraceae bacterium]|nr:hypothetical protein [Oscillospiraceae bacterium]
MKRTYKKLLALLLASLMVISLLPTAAFAESISHDDSKPMPTGYIPAEVHGTQAVSDAYRRGDMETYHRLMGEQATRDTLPSSWDSRNQGWITPVKDQNPYGSCWAHAAMGGIEAYMIKNGVPVGTGSAATTSLNLSETQHCFFNYSSAYDAEGMLTGDKCTLTGSDSCLDSGGNGEMSAYTLQRWCGAADESQSALQYSKASTVASSGLGSQYSYQYNVCHVQNSEWIPGTSIDAIKEAIMKYGAGNISYCASSGYTTYTNIYQCVIDTSSQDSSSHKWANHAITIVGWDDSIAASNFKPNKPSGSGAWLCKNSWGTSYFNQGYMWISYEDTSVGEGYIYFYDAEPIDNYAHNYQYDGSCNVVTYGIGNRTGFANNTKVANVFTAKGSELLRAVALCNWDEALTYTVEIYKNPTTGNPSSGTLMTTQTGTLTFSGYYTIPLENPVSLSAGDTFSVVFTQSVPVADESGKYVHTPYDANFNDSSVVSWANWTHTNHGNTSYYKEPNGSWTDCPDNGDYRIKAYTDDVTFTLTAVSNNTAWGTVAVNGSTINCTPAAGYYVESCDVISGTASCTINGNTVTVSASEDCTVRVNFAPKPTYTVNFVSIGSAEGTQSALVYDTIVLPSSVSNLPDGWTFSGWTASQLPEETAEAPAFYAPGAEYTVTDNATLYALFSRVKDGGAVAYELVSSAPSDWSGNYVITYGTSSTMYVMKGVTPGSNGAQIENANNASSYAASGVTLTDTTLSDVADSYVFTLAPHGSYYSIRSASTGTYVGMDSSSYLAGYTTYTSGNCDWTPGTKTNASSATNANNGSYPLLSFSTNSNYFWSGSANTSAATGVRWWKETSVASAYYTTEPEVTHTHTMTYVPAAEPTCSTPGNTEYWYCEGCGKYFSDADAENEITLADTVIPATGDHTYGGWTSNNDGTHSHYCSVCGLAEAENCTYNAAVTPPTPSEQGYTTYTCTVCGYSYVGDYTAALGYDYPVHFSVPAGVTCPADMISNTNTGIVLPTVEGPEGCRFLGWVTEDYDNVDVRPASILTGTYIAPMEITLKALFTYSVENGEEVSYQLVNEALSDWAGRYVITYGTNSSMYLMKGVTPGSNGEAIENAGNAVAYAASGVTLTDTTLSNVSDDCIFTLVPHGSYYSIQSVSTGTYVGMDSSSYLAGYTTYTSGNCDWTPGTKTDASSATNANNGGYPLLSFSTNSNYFWSGSSNTSAATGVRWWKEAPSGTAYYTTMIGMRITSQPADFTGAVGATASFTVEAIGDGLTYRWQYKSLKDGKWYNANVTGAADATMRIEVTAARSG